MKPEHNDKSKQPQGPSPDLQNGIGRPPEDAPSGEPNLLIIDDEPQIEMRSEDQLFDAQKELWEKVWFYRYHFLSPQGESPETIRKFVDKYGKENLGPWTDYEWGYLLGKLSAVNWALGHSWDLLDT